MTDSNYENYANALNESLGNLKMVSSQPEYIAVIKAELRMMQGSDVSPNSAVSPIKGDSMQEFLNDIKASNAKGRPAFIYVNTNGKANYFHIDRNAEGKVGLNTDVAYFFLKRDGDDEYISATFDANRGVSARFKALKLKEAANRMDFSKGYIGMIVYADPAKAELKAARREARNTNDPYKVGHPMGTPFYQEASKGYRERAYQRMIERNRTGEGMGVRVDTRAKDPESLKGLREIIDKASRNLK